MRKLIIGFALFYALEGYAQDSLKLVQLEEITIRSTRANEKTPTTQSSISKEQIARRNLGQDLPILLNFSPSIVTTSDAGAGVGYTGMRIRGTDGTGINVTINGIPVNDSESHGVWWVNMPDLATSLNSIQIQRGVGTSSNGAGAFGATVNLQTNNVSPESYVQSDNSFGSFNTWKSNLRFNSGLLNNNYNFEARLSKITSDGYIDRSASDLKSYYLSGGRFGEKTMIKLVMFGGQEITQQAWYGTPEARLNGNATEIQNAIWYSGEYDTQEQIDNLENSGRTFNYYLYDNEIDNYRQDHYQLHVGHTFSDNLNFSGALHYTKGRGYFEQFKEDDEFANYGWDDMIYQRDTLYSDTMVDQEYSNIAFEESFENSPEFAYTILFDINGDTIKDVSGNVLQEVVAQRTKTNIVRRRWLDNNFYGMTYAFNYDKNDLSLSLGGGYNNYDGDHFGEIIWAEFAGGSKIRDHYYDGNGQKTDFNTYLKLNFQLNGNLNLFGDAQIRTIKYKTAGLDSDRETYDVDVDYIFFNPKIGLTYSLNEKSDLYASYSIGNREPVRSDFIDASSGAIPKPEKLRNVEVGIRSSADKFAYSANYYLMSYKNQLTSTGVVNDVGAAIRINVPSSYRTGIEIVGVYRFNDQLTWSANMTISQNRIEEFTEIVFDYGAAFDEYNVIEIEHQDSDIAFSPSLIAGSDLSYSPLDGFKLQLMTKHVGKQYLDNTTDDNRSIDSYLTNDIRMAYEFPIGDIKRVELSLLINNILKEEYSSNGYTWGYFYGADLYQQNNYYPQAGTNFLAGLSVRF